MFVFCSVCTVFVFCYVCLYLSKMRITMTSNTEAELSVKKQQVQYHTITILITILVSYHYHTNNQTSTILPPTLSFITCSCDDSLIISSSQLSLFHSSTKIRYVSYLIHRQMWINACIYYIYMYLYA